MNNNFFPGRIIRSLIKVSKVEPLRVFYETYQYRLESGEVEKKTCRHIPTTESQFPHSKLTVGTYYSLTSVQLEQNWYFLAAIDGVTGETFIDNKLAKEIKTMVSGA